MDEASGSGGAEGFKPPYMAFQTFWNFIEELASHPLPPVIDRSLMNSKSGTDQANLLGALRTFGLIDAENHVQPSLTALTEKDPEARKRALADLVRTHYAAALRVSDDNGTQAQLAVCFRENYGISGADTLRKSMSFFLHAARNTDIPLSPHFPATRSGQGGPGKSKTRKPRKPRSNADTGRAGSTGQQPTDQYQLNVQLPTGGTMTLSVSVNPISLRGQDRDFFYDIVDKLTDYQEQQTGSDDSRSFDTEAAE